MKRIYVEHRTFTSSPAATLAADIARHLQARQYLGTSVIICENPVAILSAVRKQWIKLTRLLLKLRASTLSAEEILRLTHAILHMQAMQFTANSPLDQPEATVFFVSPDALPTPPGHCLTLYVADAVPDNRLAKHIAELPQNSLVVSYIGDISPGLLPKNELEQQVAGKWVTLQQFMVPLGAPGALVSGGSLQFGAMDIAFDALMGAANEFLRRTADFQHAIDLAQPFITTDPEQQKTFEAVTRLAYRIQSLTPGNFGHYLAQAFAIEDTTPFFLRGATSELYDDIEQRAAAKS